MFPIKILAALVALALLLTYLVPIGLKLKDWELAAVMAIGVVLAVVDGWQSLKSRDT
jgi:hypothetical protein